MKKLFLLISFAFLLTSCEKWPDFLIQDSEVPKWLKERIADDVKAIESNPQSGLDAAAWIRYSFLNNNYFEYRNNFSSLGPEKFDYDGDKILITQEPYLNFERDKCCKQFVWKGSSYIDY